MPRDGRLDATLALKRDPYGYLRSQCERLGSDAFQTRILLQRTICVTGPQAAQLFYDPQRFQPERFAAWNDNPFTFVPRGGGNAATGHRCPGEWITLELMRRAARWLAGGMAYQVPPQDLALDMTRLPAIPKSGFMIAVQGG